MKTEGNEQMTRWAAYYGSIGEAISAAPRLGASITEDVCEECDVVGGALWRVLMADWLVSAVNRKCRGLWLVEWLCFRSNTYCFVLFHHLHSLAQSLQSEEWLAQFGVHVSDYRMSFCKRPSNERWVIRSSEYDVLIPSLSGWINRGNSEEWFHVQTCWRAVGSKEMISPHQNGLSRWIDFSLAWRFQGARILQECRYRHPGLLSQHPPEKGRKSYDER